jgi:hypothetical protein
MGNRYIQLVKLDYLALSSYLKFLIIFFALGIVNALFDASGIMSIILISFISNTIFQSYLFGAEGKYDLDRLYASLPVTNKDIVLSRYLSGLILSVEIYVPFVLLAIIIAVCNGQTSMLSGFLSMLGASYGLSLFFVSIEFPLLYRYGFTKVQFIQAIPFLIVMALIFLMREFFNTDIISYLSLSPYFSVMVLVIGCVLFFISFFIACRIRNKKLG